MSARAPVVLADRREPLAREFLPVEVRLWRLHEQRGQFLGAQERLA